MYTVATDIGGTCTDTAVMKSSGTIVQGKALTTYPDFSNGIFESLDDAVQKIDCSVEELLSDTKIFIHSTSVGDNTIFEKTGAKVGLLTTAGFEETIESTRGGYGRIVGRSHREIKDVVRSSKPEPLVDPDQVLGVKERTYQNETIKSPSSDEIKNAVNTLVDDGVESIACCFLWSPANPTNEQKAKSVINEVTKELPVSLSSDLSTETGEFERTSTTVLNAYLVPKISTYLENLREKLSERGFGGQLLLMFSHGGSVTVDEAINKPIGLIESGPVGGLIGSKYTAENLNTNKVISIDMGGTTFKCGIIDGDLIDTVDDPLVGRYNYQFPKKDIHSVPVAGGSIISLDENGIPEVGPESAGSDPGPVCYGNGGENPTVTDVNMILGYFQPDFFLGGGESMTPEKARTAFKSKIADPLDRSIETAAADIYELIISIVVDFVRKKTVEVGIDPRDFLMSSIGGASGMHAAAVASELNIPEVVIPASASVHSAVGLLTTDVVYEESENIELSTPFDHERVYTVAGDLEDQIYDKLYSDGFDTNDMSIDLFAGLRYQRQVHEVQTPLKFSDSPTRQNMTDLIDRFERQYEKRYGTGSKFRRGEIEMTEIRARGAGEFSNIDMNTQKKTKKDTNATVAERSIYFGTEDPITTPIYDYQAIPGDTDLSGPCIIASPITTAVVRPTDIAVVDQSGNIKIKIGDNNE